MIGANVGRTPTVHGGQGRDHHEYGCWAMAAAAFAAAWPSATAA
jgi:hypothetical protein